MSIGRRADDDGVDVIGGLDLADRAHLGAILRGKRVGRIGHGIGHGNETGVRI